MTSTMAARVVAFGLLVLSFVVRLGSNMLGAFNFNPVGALCIFGGARLRWWQALALTLGMMVVTDLILEQMFQSPLYGLSHPSRIWVYGSYVLCILIGTAVIGESKDPLRIGTATLLGAIVFFLVTNFCEWRFSDRYANNEMGLLASYVAAIPFAKNSFIGDAIFTPLAFLAQVMLTRETKPALDESLSTANR